MPGKSLGAHAVPIASDLQDTQIGVTGNDSKAPYWIAVDWGTSNLRAYAMSQTDQVVAEASSEQGMAKLESHQFEDALLNLIQPWLSDTRVTPVYACGMVGARQGWVEAPYRSVPCRPVCDQGMIVAPTHSSQVQVHILPGLSQSTPADVMRGEETQLAGLLHSDPELSSTICLPGTHCKWVSMTEGVVISFRTFMTGELFSLLSQQSVLRHGMTGDQWDKDTFLDCALATVEKPMSVNSRLFSLRAEGLLHDLEPMKARSMLSGMLIGQELGAVRDLWSSQSVIIVGADQLSTLYADTLIALDATVQQVDASEATVAGLTQFARLIREEHS